MNNVHHVMTNVGTNLGFMYAQGRGVKKDDAKVNACVSAFVRQTVFHSKNAFFGQNMYFEAGATEMLFFK